MLRDLQHPSEMFSNITPNWYASIMGTGIVAVAAASLPVQFPGLRVFGVVVWAAAAILLVLLTGATAMHWARYRSTARGHHLDPVMAHFYGAPPMAMLTVGAGTLLLGKDVLGAGPAVAVDWVLWVVGTLTGLAAAGVVPYLQFTRHEGVNEKSAFGGWLMPVVPPMVSASTGALLVPHTPAGQARLTLLLACYAMFGLALVASLIVITLIWYRLATQKVGEARMVPTLWIVLGPLGQSITAANLLGGVANKALPAPYSTAFKAFAVVYGVPVWGFALLWACLAAAMTARTARQGLPFSLTWWSFTFPVGTCVTGTSGLALHTGSTVLHWAAALFYVGLLIAWATVAVRTAHGSVRGTLFRPAPLPTAGPLP
ncbi:TDT family transporter [Allobranchiibius sp. GilTou73]|uniref:TDT family transporter n=1 Tax=Allobranchiibius sp. GilTou73 TaxID=2904523 RepID=UPI001F1BF009|nr:TDT family transporter [Allobranchiibius sp. GilTou73]UIJ33744.1 TDT family transporter [Allobranchiibius sp. GilTou73]